MRWFWQFAGYGFLGFLLENAHARARRDGSERRCLLVLPLCPVYGIGGWVCTLLSDVENPAAAFLLGAAGCTAAEYGMGAWYEWCAGCPFWDYRGERWNVRGRVCGKYSALWGALSLAGSRWVSPPLDAFAALAPPPVTALSLLLVLTDLCASHWLLRRTRDRSCLRRYGFPREKKFPCAGEMNLPYQERNIP